jgi:hypothetical protein
MSSSMACYDGTFVVKSEAVGNQVLCAVEVIVQCNTDVNRNKVET